MQRFARLLVGLDLAPSGKEVSAGARRAALQARSLAEKTGASIVFYHSTYAEQHGGLRDADEGVSSLAPAGVAAIEAVTREHAQTGVPTRLVVSEERPVLALVRCVLRGEADLVLVGKRGNPEPDGRAFGTVAVKLLRKCPAPVWAVHPERDIEYRRVLAATDLTPVGDLAVELAASVADAYGAELHVVHAYQISFSLQLESAELSEPEYAARLRAIEEAAERQIAAVLSGACASPGHRLHVGCTSPNRGILEALDHVAPDLLVMGTLSRGGIAGLLVGNTAERLLARVPCSLLAIKAADFKSPIHLD